MIKNERLKYLKRKGFIILSITILLYLLIFIFSMFDLARYGYANILQIIILIGISFLTVVFIIIFIALDIWSEIYDIELINKNVENKEEDTKDICIKSFETDIKESVVKENNNLTKKEFNIEDELFKPLEKVKKRDITSIKVNEDTDKGNKLSIDDFVNSDISNILKVMAVNSEKEDSNEKRDSLS